MGRPVLPETNDVLKWRHRADRKLGNLMCKHQVLASDAYRQGWDRIFKDKEDSVRASHNTNAS